MRITKQQLIDDHAKEIQDIQTTYMAAASLQSRKMRELEDRIDDLMDSEAREVNKLQTIIDYLLKWTISQPANRDT